MVNRRGSQRRSLIPWSPFRDWDMEEMDLENLFGKPLFPPSRRAPAIQDGDWAPAVDIFEKDSKFVVKAEIPGMNQDDIDVSVTDELLSIRGEKKTERDIEEKDYLRSERTYGSFLRLIPLPSMVDPNKVAAHYEDGVLEVSIPKLVKTEPKKVTVTGKKPA